MGRKNDASIAKSRVILTYGRSLMALTAAHSLAKKGIEVIGCDSVDMTVLNFSKHVSDFFVHFPYEDNVEKYLDDLEENIRKFKPEDDRPYVLMPMFRDAEIIAAHKHRFEKLINIAAPDIKAIHQVQPKDAFARTCQDLELSAPKTLIVEDHDALKAKRSEIVLPALIKPIEGVGGRGIKKVSDFEALEKNFKESLEKNGQAPLVQEVIKGQDYCLAALCDDGEIVAHMAYKNLYQFPYESGAGIMRETIESGPFFDTAQTLLKALNWHGIAQVDFRWSGNAQDPAYLIEVNPRFWAGLFHSVETGVDFPWLLYQLVVNGHVDDSSHAIIGAKTKVPGLWTLSAIHDIADSETHFDRLAEAWKSIWDKTDSKSLKEKIVSLKEALTSAVDFQDIKKDLKEMREIGKEAKSELDTEGDPFTNLGILFVISSLLRHGELPPELKS